MSSRAMTIATTRLAEVGGGGGAEGKAEGKGNQSYKGKSRPCLPW